MGALFGALRGAAVRRLHRAVAVHAGARSGAVRKHTLAVQRRAEKVYGQAVDRGLFATAREELVALAPNLYPLHPSVVSALAVAVRRFGQNERSLFGFLQSLEPAGFKRFAHSAHYGRDCWYLAPLLFDHLAATISDAPGGERARRWSLAFDALAGVADLPQGHHDVLKTVALVAVLEPLPGLVANTDAIAWSLGVAKTRVQPVLDELKQRNLIYRVPIATTTACGQVRVSIFRVGWTWPARRCALQRSLRTSAPSQVHPGQRLRTGITMRPDSQGRSRSCFGLARTLVSAARMA